MRKNHSRIIGEKDCSEDCSEDCSDDCDEDCSGDYGDCDCDCDCDEDDESGKGPYNNGGVLDNANFSQKTYNPNKFSDEGIKYYSEMAGEEIQNVDDLVSALESGKISPSQVPIDYIERDGNTLILNTRSSQALTQAEIPRNQWNAVNRTGNELYEELLTNQLNRNKLTSEGISTVRPSGQK